MRPEAFPSASQFAKPEVWSATSRGEVIQSVSQFVRPEALPATSQFVKPEAWSATPQIKVMKPERHAPSALSRIIGAQPDDLTNVMTRVLLLSACPSELTGTCKACHHQAGLVLGLVYATLLGHDSTTHECVIYCINAIILGVLSQSTSPKKQFLASGIQDFVICPAAHRPTLIAASETGRPLNLQSPK